MGETGSNGVNSFFDTLALDTSFHYLYYVMEKDKLKLELLERIINCDDASILKKVEEILNDLSEVHEGGEKYVKEVDPVPADFYKELEEEFEDYKKGDSQGVSWEELRQEIKNKYGF